MYKDKTFLGWIPARGGSKGIKNKNIRIMNGKPLIYWAIKAAVDSNVFDSIVVSSDSDEILRTVLEFKRHRHFWGVEAQKRPAELATDKSLVADAMVDSLRRLDRKYDYVQLIQPTSPLLRPASIVNAANYIIAKRADMIMGVRPAKDPTAFCKELPLDFSIRNWYPQEFKNKNRQDLPTRYSLNGYIYIARWDIFTKRCDWWDTNIYAYIMGEHDDVDIDDEWDWELAEMRLKQRHPVLKFRWSKLLWKLLWKY